VRSADTNGIVIGVVSDLDDPDSLGRVKVTYPHLDDQESDWAPLVTLMAGGSRGARFCPEPEDKVLVGFEHGDPQRPYILGGLWDSDTAPPANDGDTTANNWRFFVSRSGHVIKLDDTDGAERIEIVDKDGQRRIVIDSSGSKIQITCDSGDIEISAPSGKVSVDAQSIELKATTTIDIEATGQLTLKGATVNIN
jgi:uncharacterized protein involved in type VI secretion and phage assembly